MTAGARHRKVRNGMVLAAAAASLATVMVMSTGLIPSAVANASPSTAGESPRIAINARGNLSGTGSYAVVDYPGQGSVSGQVRGADANGAEAELEARPYPYAPGFRSLRHLSMGPNGTFTFAIRPELATRYRVAVPSLDLVSQVKTVYVGDPLHITGTSSSGCNVAPPTTCDNTSRGWITFSPALASAIRSGPWYVYGGRSLVGGEDPDLSPPDTLRIDPDQTVIFTHRGGYTWSFSWTYSFVIGSQYADSGYSVASESLACLGKPVGGLNLPKVPVYPGCGKPRIVLPGSSDEAIPALSTPNPPITAGAKFGATSAAESSGTAVWP